MKKTITILAGLFLACSVNAQSSKKEIKIPIDSVHVTDSTGLLQTRDIAELIQLLQDYPAKYANPITNWLINRNRQREMEYRQKGGNK